MRKTNHVLRWKRSVVLLEYRLQINLEAKITWIEPLTCSSIVILWYFEAVRSQSKIQAVIHIYATTEGPQGKSRELFESSCCATQRESKWQAPERGAKKYGPATIREAIKRMQDQSSGKMSFKMMKVWRKYHISVVK